MSNRHSFKLQFEGRIRSNCRGLNNIKIDQNYNDAKIVMGNQISNIISIIRVSRERRNEI